eukprot:CAMPEP_0169107316 /NCGR_PEP_ID=MMETSP1015-20121227/24815_1 /TAXON_ID=342587 /ORGANISM="Karlodinium micrum, Strain CCMP2283" /LENGTH=402 /DNA_ID=CAMNT_0009168835 /DNA_START=119 /DNA_END=1327 /DNA_ORIENTATION=-
MIPIYFSQSVIVFSLLCVLDRGAYASSHALYLRSGRSQTRQKQPTIGMDVSRTTFDQLDLNKDGKIDAQEFLAAQRAAATSRSNAISMNVQPSFAVAPSAASPGVPLSIAPSVVATAPAPFEAINVEDLPEHMRPPPLPSDIPEPPPPPRVPPREPQPPPFPPKEGQLVGPPPSEASVIAAGNLTQVMAEGVPGLDLDGTSPLQAPNTPPPVPVPVLPPDLPQTVASQKPPPPLDPALMTPAPQAFGMDVARSYSVVTSGGSATEASLPTMPSLPTFPTQGAVLLSINSQKVNASRTWGVAAAPIDPPGRPPRLPPAPPGARIAVTSTTLPEGAGGLWRVGRPKIPPLLHGAPPNNFALPRPYVEPTTTTIMPMPGVVPAPAPVAMFAPAPAGRQAPAPAPY